MATRKRRSPARRRTTRRAPARRRPVRRRRNPKLDITGGLIATGVGLAVGLGAWALQGQTTVGPQGQALIAAGVGLAGGVALSGYSPRAGMALVGGGTAIAAASGASMLMAPPGAETASMRAVRAQMNAVRAQMGAVRTNFAQPQAQRAYAYR